MTLTGGPNAGPAEWLRSEWISRLAGAFEAMAGEPLKAAPAAAADPAGAEAHVWRQEFDAAPGAAVEVRMPARAWRFLGGKVLAAAGIEDAADEDTRPTYLELLQQSLSGVASALSARLGREISCSQGREVAPASGWLDMAVEFVPAAGEPVKAVLAVAEALLTVLQPPPLAAPDPAAAAAPAPSQAAASSAANNAMELLFDVELPVSISFGRAHLPLKDVLKLTSGSIVELNRTIAEPVEVIVNNCVIARGEVVVVEGNYGVRITEVISRSERLRTLH